MRPVAKAHSVAIPQHYGIVTAAERNFAPFSQALLFSWCGIIGSDPRYAFTQDQRGADLDLASVRMG